MVWVASRSDARSGARSRCCGMEISITGWLRRARAATLSRRLRAPVKRSALSNYSTTDGIESRRLATRCSEGVRKGREEEEIRRRWRLLENVAHLMIFSIQAQLRLAPRPVPVANGWMEGQDPRFRTSHVARRKEAIRTAGRFRRMIS